MIASRLRCHYFTQKPPGPENGFPLAQGFAIHKTQAARQRVNYTVYTVAGRNMTLKNIYKKSVDREKLATRCWSEKKTISDLGPFLYFYRSNFFHLSVSLCLMLENDPADR